MSNPTVIVNIMDLEIGHIVHFHGARFEITKKTVVKNRSMHEEFNADRDTIMCANGVWLDGAKVNGYFGPNKDWNFQGNKNVSHAVEL